MLRMTIIRVDGGHFYSRIYVQIPDYTSVLNGSGNYINQISRSPLKKVWPRFIKRVLIPKTRDSFRIRLTLELCSSFFHNIH
jgi:hypothetical protein